MGDTSGALVTVLYRGGGKRDDSLRINVLVAPIKPINFALILGPSPPPASYMLGLETFPNPEFAVWGVRVDHPTVEVKRDAVNQIVVHLVEYRMYAVRDES
ncbi:hypothetical protein M231_02961 [Tremella mesenterica]|uniref:Uncharacterized protein n=1 Tax=Tremella mesenterica TaxID=5217 RepID=A0A4Q1BPD8_TREME|nr:hypothetical protein M231_02961 [Tremella mesenterica]